MTHKNEIRKICASVIVMLRFFCPTCFSGQRGKKAVKEQQDSLDESDEEKDDEKANLVELKQPKPGILKKKPSNEKKDSNGDSGACLEELIKKAQSEQDNHQPEVAEPEPAQLTVSSVNTVLEDLVETDDEIDDNQKTAKQRPTFQRQISEGASKRAEAAAKRRVRTRDPSPTVSFKEQPSVINPDWKRQRSRSDASRFKFRSPSSSFSGSVSAASAGTGATSKMSWLKSKSKSTEMPLKSMLKKNPSDLVAAMVNGYEEALCGRDSEVEEFESRAVAVALDAELKKAQRARTRSDRFEIFRRRTLSADKATSDRPFGRFGKQWRQRNKAKNEKLEEEARSASTTALTRLGNEPYDRLKRRHSERRPVKATPAHHPNSGMRVVAFTEPSAYSNLAASIWSASIKFFWGDNQNQASSKTRRRRHMTDPSNFIIESFN